MILEKTPALNFIYNNNIIISPNKRKLEHPKNQNYKDNSKQILLQYSLTRHLFFKNKNTYKPHNY